jgi:cytochrome c oxidase subunit I
LFITAGVWVHSLLRGRRAPANPWGGNTLEWHTSSPPPHDNFARTPIAGDPYRLDHWQYDEKNEQYVLRPDVREDVDLAAGSPGRALG